MPGVNEDRSLKQLKVTYDMYEKTKKETTKRMKAALNPDGTKKYTKADIDKELDLINNAEKDIIDQYQMYGGNLEDLKKTMKKSAPSISDADEIAKAALELMNETEDVKTAINAGNCIL